MFCFKFSNFAVIYPHYIKSIFLCFNADFDADFVELL